MEQAVKLDKAGILDFLTYHKADLRKYGVRTIGLFGSYARGEEKAGSDV